jgi:arginase
MRWTVLGVPVDSVAAPAGGGPFGTEESPAALRSLGLVGRLGAADGGDLDVRITGPHRDEVSGIVGWPSVASVVTGVRTAVASLLADGQRPLLLGGCCTILMGAAPAARDAFGRIGLAYVDGHVDLYDNRTSPTGEAADMPVAALLGRGWPDLLATMGTMPVLRGADIVIMGARDQEEAADIGDLPERLGLTVHGPDAIKASPASVGRAARDRFTSAGVPYWLHLDVDVLDEDVFPATDYLMPGGLDLGQLARLMRPLGHDPALIGASVGCYNPQKDQDRECGLALADVLADALGEVAEDR